ncbi:MAG: hypothetical protein ACK5LO_03965 [Leucobacter sp.]
MNPGDEQSADRIPEGPHHPGHQQPGEQRYAPPAHPQYAVPGSTPAAYAPRPPTGAVAWALGFLVFIPIPFFSVLVAGVVMIAVGLSMRKVGGIARANGRNAANWGVTVIALTVLLVGGHFIMLYLLTRDGPVSGGFFPIGILITIWVLVVVAHVVFVIIGLVKASGGKVFRALAIPFFGP